MHSAAKNYPYPGISTVPYVAPEHMQHLDPASDGPPDGFNFKSQDMWSMGCLLLHMLLTGSDCHFIKDSRRAIAWVLSVEEWPWGRLKVQARHADWVRHM